MAARLKASLYGALIAAAVAVTATGSAFAQESTNRVATKTDWSVFTEENPKECWGVSSPKETVNTRDGNPSRCVGATSCLFVTFRPGTGAAGEISFTGGYPFDPQFDRQDGRSTTRASRCSSTANGRGLRIQPTTPRCSAALKSGASAVLTARSARGTQTKDTFSLLGFTAAMQEAETRCK